MRKHGRHNPEIERIVIRAVHEEAIFWRQRNHYYPACRRSQRHNGTTTTPWWNVRYSYKTNVQRGGGQSLYFCNAHLPARYLPVVDEMIKRGEESRIIKGDALEGVAPR